MEGVAAQQGMQLYQQTELMYHETQGKYIQQNLQHLGQFSERNRFNLCLCIFRQFIEETNMVPTPESVYYKHYQDFLASLTDHVKKMIFLPEQIVTMGVLFAHGRNCSQFEVVRRMLTMLHLALNIRVRNLRTAESKAEAIVQYIQIGEDKDR